MLWQGSRVHKKLHYSAMHCSDLRVADCGWGLRIADCGLRIADCGLRIADCGLRIADCGLRIADCGLRIADCGIADCGLRIADCGLRIADCGLRIADCGLRIADCGLRIADCGLRIADCGLRIARMRVPHATPALRMHESMRRLCISLHCEHGSLSEHIALQRQLVEHLWANMLWQGSRVHNLTMIHCDTTHC